MQMKEKASVLSQKIDLAKISTGGDRLKRVKKTVRAVGMKETDMDFKELFRIYEELMLKDLIEGKVIGIGRMLKLHIKHYHNTRRLQKTDKYGIIWRPINDKLHYVNLTFKMATSLKKATYDHRGIPYGPDQWEIR